MTKQDDELRGPYAAPITRRGVRAQLQRERAALTAIASGRRVFRRRGDPPAIYRVVDGPVFNRDGWMCASVRAFEDRVEDAARRCIDCPLSDLIPAAISAPLPVPTLEWRDRLTALLPDLSSIETDEGYVVDAIARFTGGELRLTLSPESCGIFFAFGRVVIEVDAPTLGDALQRLVDVIVGLPIGVPAARREAFVAGVLLAVVGVDDAEVVEQIIGQHDIGPREALRVAGITDGLEPVDALLATVQRDHPQILSLDPSDSAFDAVGPSLAPSAPWHVDVLGEIGPHFVDETAVAFMIEASDATARSAFTALLAQELQHDRHVTVIRDVRLIEASGRRSIGIAIIDVEIADDQQRDALCRFVAPAPELEGVVVLSGNGDERARAVWQAASADWCQQPVMFSTGASVETRIHPDCVDDDE